MRDLDLIGDIAPRWFVGYADRLDIREDDAPHATDQVSEDQERAV